MELSIKNYDEVRKNLEKQFFGDEQEFIKLVQEFYKELGFGKYYATQGEECISVKCASIGAEITKLKVDSAEAVEEKRRKAQDFSKVLAKFPISARLELANAIAAEVENYAQIFTLIFATDTGKPLQLGASEISGKGAQWVKWASGVEVLESLRPVLKHKNAEKRSANAKFSPADVVSLTTHVPSGDVGAIGGYNYLYALVINKLIQSIVTGNGTIIKAGQQGPHWVFLLVDKVVPAALEKFLSGKTYPLAQEMRDNADGLCQVVVGRRKNDPFLQCGFLAFTGSATGAAAIAEERGFGRSAFERGGNSPVIISPSYFENGDAKKLAKDLVAALNNSGQRCTAPRQIYLLDGVEKTDFIKFLEVEFNSIFNNPNYLGNPYSFETKNGPVVDIKAAAVMQEIITKARAENSKVIGGKRIFAELHPNSNYIQPAAVFWSRTEYREDMCNEVFAPIFQVVQGLSLNDAVEYANRSNQQLAAAVYTADGAEVAYVRQNLKCGSLQVNSMPADPSPLAPHVDSIGHADGGENSLSKYSKQEVIEGPYSLIKKYADEAEFIFSGKLS